MYELHNLLRPLLLLMYSFWIPQIITNIIRDTRKPLHPHYIVGMTITRLAIPLYVFGCPNNFMRIEHDKNWCLCLVVFMGLQALILLLQHYLGSRWFIPRQVWIVFQFALLIYLLILLICTWHVFLFNSYSYLQNIVLQHRKDHICIKTISTVLLSSSS